MKTCSIEGCQGKFLAKTFCNKHYTSFKVHGDPLASRTKRKDFSGCVRKDGYVIYQENNIKILAHVRIAEKALGRPLPAGAVVHHIDENPSNNAPSNLAIFPNQAYHMLIHARMRALEACGNPNSRKCHICKNYDSIENLNTDAGGKISHRACTAKKARDYRSAKTSTAKEHK